MSARPAMLAQPGEPENGERRTVDGTDYIYYHGYWVRYYPPLEESLASRKTLIDHLTRRAFHHTEPGINTPGERLDTARAFYLRQTDPAMKRVNAAMLAGALFNRATDIFTAIVELEEKGVRISRDNELMKSCGNYFKEALELGHDVRHFSGEEGIDELWGEPFRAFTLPITAYYESRFIKVAQTMANIDKLANHMRKIFCERPEFKDIEELLDNYAKAAKHECETMKSDVCIFEIWPRFIATGEALGQVQPRIQPNCSKECRYVMEEAQKTLIAGRNLINWVARARVPMPRSTAAYFARCESLKERFQVC
ncbi:MAG: hypothetical protein HKN42_16010 [Granulosicoccus sp.]|nr:hypothetical protein [Granulosicoccus sp.]